jgi:aspartokinase-like uncharacterized kinase/SAM-dependent methyltransferase
MEGEGQSPACSVNIWADVVRETQTKAVEMEHDFQGVDSECRGEDEDVVDLGLLADWLARSGYGEFVASFDPLVPRPNAWRACRESVPISLRQVVDLFLMNEPVEADAIPTSLQALIPALMDIGLIVEQAGNRIATPGLVILPVWGNWLICERPGANPAFYFGDDSVALLARMLPRSDGDCLDLCTGPGLHALHCARFARSVAAVDIDATAARLARINARLNRVADRMDVFHGDLYQPVAGRRFHTVVANPPLLPYPDALPGPRVGCGGPDGFRIIGRILEGLPQALRDGGVAQIIGMTLSDGCMPVIAGRLDSMARELDMKIRFSALSHKRLMSGDAYYDLVTGSMMHVSGQGDSIVKDALRTMLTSQQCSHLCTFFLHVVPGNGQFDLIDVSQPDRPGFWYILEKVGMATLVKIGGSLIPGHVEKLCSSLREVAGAHPILLIAGGGELVDVVRSYRKKLALSDETAYSMAVLAMDQHAYLLAEIGGFAISRSLRELMKRRTVPQVFAPSDVLLNLPVNDVIDIDRMTSDTIAAFVAGWLGADLIIATDTDGIYSADPDVVPDAMFLERVRACELTHATSVDAEAVRMIRRWNVRTWVVNGTVPDRLVRCLRGQPTRGTEIVLD